MKYKIGDKVRIINTKKGFEHRKEYIGQTVTVKRVNPNGERTYNEPHYSVKENIPFIFFESELASVPVNTQKIVITSDGTETLARLYDGNKVIKTATAKCSPADTFDFETGARIAFDRLIESPLTKALKKLRDAVASVKVPKFEVKVELKPYEPPKYYNGKVVCVEKSASYMAYTVGKVYEFKDGRVKIDNEYILPPAGRKAVETLAEWNNDATNYGKFIPFVE